MWPAALAAVSSRGRRVVTVVGSAPGRLRGARPVEVLALDPAGDGVQVPLPTDAVDITEHRRPLVPRLLDADSSTVIHSMEDLDTGDLPSAADAVEGILDV